MKKATEVKTTAVKPAAKTTAVKPAAKTTAVKPAAKTTAVKPAAKSPVKPAAETAVKPMPVSDVQPMGERTSKKSEAIKLMQRTQGATIADIMALTGWLQHSTRGFLSILNKANGGNYIGTKLEDGRRSYHIAKAGK